MPQPILANATDLVTWASTREAQANLPRLVRRLVYATAASLKRIEFRADEGVQLSGWDGIVEVEDGNAFVPAGISGWEMGTDTNIKAKADGDFEKRTQDSCELTCSETTFVFVTPRRWRGKTQWAASRRTLGVWRDVKAYDADDLETWLEMASGVHIWTSTLLGKRPDGVSDISNAWTEWAAATQPSVSFDLVIGGRDPAVKQLHHWLQSEPSALTLQGDSSDEAFAFFAAALDRLSPIEQGKQLARGVVVYEKSAWQLLKASQTPLLLIPMFEDRSVVAGTSKQGHHVLVPTGRSDSDSSQTLTLPRSKRESAEVALKAMGFPKDRASDLATLARRSLMSLRRKLAILPEVQRPQWASASEGSTLLPVMLLGKWNESAEGDREVVSTLARSSYEDFNRLLVRWANESDPPVRRVGATWLLVSTEDAWSLLARLLTPDDLERFGKVVLDVLGQVDPAFELPDEKRWMANVLGHGPKYSGMIRGGIADSLAFMGARSESIKFVDGVLAQDRATRIVRELLTRANADWRVWATMSGALQSLAEAAPSAFLDAVDVGLAGTDPVLRKLFTESDNPMFSSSHHTELLWALELLAWSPEYLGRAALALAKLDRLDPGGKLLNRPLNSLRDIFLFWLPHTEATFDTRLKVIDALRTREPGAAWRLLCRLLPEDHGSVSPTAKPKWRDWIPDSRVDVTWSEIYKGASEVTDRLLADVGVDGTRWAELIGHLDALPLDAHVLVVERLLSVRTSAFPSAHRQKIWNALRHLISRHRSFPNAGWAMPSRLVNRLERAYHRFEPKETIAKYSWLFSNAPALVRSREDHWEQHYKTLQATRIRAVRSIFGKGGLPLVVKMAMKVERPFEVGLALGRTRLIRGKEVPVLRREVGSRKPHRADFARGLVNGIAEKRGFEWIEKALSAEQHWSATQRADILACLPFNSRTWNLVESFGSSVERLYWKRVNGFGAPGAEEGIRAAQMYLKYERPYTAVDLLAMHTHNATTELPAELIADALERAIQTDPRTDPQADSFGYHAGQLLNSIELSGKIDEQRLAQLEWVYLPITKHWHAQTPRVLHRALAQDPEFFAQIVGFITRGDEEPIGEVSPEATNRARIANELLESWRTIPAVKEDGSIDQDALKEWVIRARATIEKSGRKIADSFIGQTLRYCAADENGVWPAVSIRNLIEDLASEKLESAIEIEVYNSRGVTSRGLTDGGAQERSIAERYSGWAKSLSTEWPRTAAMLQRIADTYIRDARREDADAELTEDLWQ